MPVLKSHTLDPNKRVDNRHKITTFVELSLLGFFLLLFPPWKGMHIASPVPVHTTAYRNINVSLGLLKKNLFPCYSMAFSHHFVAAMKHNPEELIHLDLRNFMRAKEWPDQPYEPVFFKGQDSGMVFLIVNLWKISGNFSLQTIIGFLLTLHVFATFSLFFLLRSAGTPGFALLSALGLAYSPTVLRNFFYFSHYSFPVFSICISLFLFFAGMFMIRRFWKWPVLFLSGSVMAVFASLRVTSALLIVPLAGILFVKLVLHRSKRDGVILVCLLFGFFTASFLANQMIWTPERLSYHQTRYHLLWHPIWAGLGEVENPHGFVWSDYTALQFARSKDPTVEFNSPGFEEILRNHVFSTFRKDPLFFVIAPLKKMHHFTKIWIHYLPWPDNVPTWLSVLLFWFGVLGSFFGVVLKKDTRMVWILVPLCFYFSIPILISSRFYFYNNAAYLATSVCLFYSLTEGISWGIRRIFQREV